MLKCKDIAKSPVSMSDTEYVADTIACLWRVKMKKYVYMYVLFWKWQRHSCDMISLSLFLDCPTTYMFSLVFRSTSSHSVGTVSSIGAFSLIFRLPLMPLVELEHTNTPSLTFYHLLSIWIWKGRSLYSGFTVMKGDMK